MTARPRDSQRARVYRAGWDLSHPGWDREDRAALAPPARLSLSETQALIDRVLPGIRRVRPAVASIWATDGRGSSRGRARQRMTTAGIVGRVALPHDMRHPAVVAHEVAHVVTPRTCASHGPEFAAAFLALAEAIDRRLGRALAVRMRHRRVRIDRAVLATWRERLAEPDVVG